jgi:hypothetical protein
MRALQPGERYITFQTFTPVRGPDPPARRVREATDDPGAENPLVGQQDEELPSDQVSKERANYRYGPPPGSRSRRAPPASAACASTSSPRRTRPGRRTPAS